MSKKKSKSKEVPLKTTKRLFLITKIILCIIPFTALAYLSVGQREYGLDYRELLSANPVLAITFLSAMCQPLAALLLNVAEKRLTEKEYSDALISILLIFTAECMLKNWIAIAAVFILFWRINREIPGSYKEIFRSFNKKKILSDVSGCIVLILISSLCLYASYNV